jgi:pyochelin synthetase
MVPTLVQILRARGITLWLDGERVRCRAPKGHLTASDRSLLTVHRTALVT